MDRVFYIRKMTPEGYAYEPVELVTVRACVSLWLFKSDMYTITLEESKKRANAIVQSADTLQDKLIKLMNLIELTYKSGKYDGWYDAKESD